MEKNFSPEDRDAPFMREALREATLAKEADEVPIGAVIVRDGKIIARAHNTREGDRCATHHAEILAIEQACRALGGWRLVGATLYVTLEPCAMCAGAIVNARIPTVVFGARDPRFGALGSRLDLNEAGLNHRAEVRSGVLAEECARMLSEYFQKKRKADTAAGAPV